MYFLTILKCLLSIPSCPSIVCKFSSCQACYDLILHTDKKKKNFFLYKEIQVGAVAKSYMRKGFLIYKEMRKFLVIYEKAISHIRVCNLSLLDFLIYEENFVFFFISAGTITIHFNKAFVPLTSFKRYNVKNIDL